VQSNKNHGPRSRRVWCVAGALTACVMSVPCAAADIPSGYIGGWVTGSDTCGDVFTGHGDRLAYRKPVDAFAPAILVSPRQIATPTTRCAVVRVRPVDDRIQVRLSCATSVAVDTIETLFRLEPDGTLKRFLNEKDHTGSTYRHCSPADL
jgi:hypothetical protein